MSMTEHYPGGELLFAGSWWLVSRRNRGSLRRCRLVNLTCLQFTHASVGSFRLLLTEANYFGQLSPETASNILLTTSVMLTHLTILEQNPYAMAGRILCIYFVTGYTYFFHDSFACFFLFWLWRTRSWVSKQCWNL